MNGEEKTPMRQAYCYVRLALINTNNAILKLSEAGTAPIIKKDMLAVFNDLNYIMACLMAAGNLPEVEKDQEQISIGKISGWCKDELFSKEIMELVQQVHSKLPAQNLTELN